MTSSGNKDSDHNFIIESAFDASVLSDFYCGNHTIDAFIHNELQDYLDMSSCKLFIVRARDVVIGMFCLENSNLTLSESAKSNMQEGKKPMPDSVSLNPDDIYWIKPMYEATEITYFAIKEEWQHKYIGSYIIDVIVGKVSQSKDFVGDYVIVRALNEEGYTAIPFYKKCGFIPAKEQRKNQNLFMYRVVVK